MNFHIFSFFAYLLLMIGCSPKDFAQSQILISYELRMTCDSNEYLEWEDFYWTFNNQPILPSDSVVSIKNNYPQTDTLHFWDRNRKVDYPVYLRLNPEKNYVLCPGTGMEEFNIFEKQEWENHAYKIYDNFVNQEVFDSIYHFINYDEKLKVTIKGIPKGDTVLFTFGNSLILYPGFGGMIVTQNEKFEVSPYSSRYEMNHHRFIISRVENADIRYWDQPEDQPQNASVDQKNLDILQHGYIRLFAEDSAKLFFDYQRKRIKLIFK